MTNERRVAVAIPSLDGGGAERVVVNLLRGFVDAGLEVDLLLVRPRGPLLDEVPSEVEIVPLAGGRIIASLPSLVRYLRHRRPDVVLSHLDSMNLVALWARRLAGVPARVVVTTHIALSRHASGGSLRQRIVARLVGRAYRSADAVVAVSRGVAADLERRIRRRDSIRVIYNPIVSPELRKRADSVRSMPAAELPGVPANARLVLSVGRLTPQKNQALLLEAFEALAGDVPEAHLVILGEGGERQALEQRAGELGLEGRISLPGFVEDVAPWYAAADVFVLSSDWEGLPTVLIEALLYGCPVVSTRCPSGPEEILEDGRYGRLVPMRDAPALAEAIRATLREPPDPARLRARAADFATDRAVREYLRALFPEDEV
ncbi:MAG: glycosyltransferase [Gemmatimonadota bacterium]